MSNSIKIILLAFVVLVLAVPTFLFFSKIDPASEERITCQDFEEIIKEQVNSDLSKHPIKSAVTAFHDLWGKVQTEEFVSTTEGKKVISEEELEKCREIIYKEYAPIFTKFVLDTAFVKTSWNESDLDYFKNHAQYLEKIYCGSDIFIKDDLTKIQKVVSDYYAALAVIKRADNCRSVQAVKDVRSDAQKYQKEPLTNNIHINGSLGQAFDNAKKSFAGYITRRGNEVINGYRSYNDYPSFDQARSEVEGLIDAYKKNFNSDSPFTNLKKQLFDTDQQAMSYFRPQPSQPSTQSKKMVNAL